MDGVRVDLEDMLRQTIECLSIIQISANRLERLIERDDPLTPDDALRISSQIVESAIEAGTLVNRARDLAAALSSG